MFIGTELEKYLAIVRRVVLDDFVRRFKGFYLFGDVDEDTPSGDLDFYTGVIHLDEISTKGKSQTSSRREVIKPGAFLLEIAKRPDSAWQSWYSVGRANNNDVVIRHPSISKLHARLDTQGPIEAQSHNWNNLWITDMGSTKGTALNGKALEASGRYPLQLGDTITFGEVQTTLLDALLLYNRLSKMGF